MKGTILFITVSYTNYIPIVVPMHETRLMANIQAVLRVSREPVDMLTRVMKMGPTMPYNKKMVVPDLVHVNFYMQTVSWTGRECSFDSLIDCTPKPAP